MSSNQQYQNLPGPVPAPAVLAIDNPLGPGALSPNLLVIGVARVPLLVVEVDVHLLGPALDHILQPSTRVSPVEGGNVESVPTVRVVVASLVETSLKAEVNVNRVVRGNPREPDGSDRTPEGESILNYFLNQFSCKICVRVGWVPMDGVSEHGHVVLVTSYGFVLF